MSTGLKAALWGAVAGAVVSGFITIAGSYVLQTVSQRHEARLQTAMEFNNRDLGLSDLAAKYIAAIAGGENTSSVATQLRGKVAEEIRHAESLKQTFASATPAIDQYQDTLQAFAASLDGAQTPTSMRYWAESFGRVIDSREALNGIIKRDVGA